MTIHVGILGTGNISGTHAEAVREIPDARITAVWGRELEKATRFARAYDALGYDSLEHFVDHPDLDLVIVGTPSGTHAEHAMVAARRRRHVLVEKPLEISTTKADELIEACDETGVTLGVIFQDRTAPDLQWLRRAIKADELGKILLVSARVPWYRPPEYYAASAWRGTWTLDGGGALMNQGIHTVDLLLWLLGDVERFSAVTRTALHDIEVEDTAVACLEFAEGAVGTLEVTTAAFPGYARQIEITGEKGTVIVVGDGVSSIDLQEQTAGPQQWSEGSTNASASSPVVKDVRGHRRVIEDFIDAIQRDRAPLCDGRDGRRSIALIEAIYAATRRA